MEVEPTVIRNLTLISKEIEMLYKEVIIFVVNFDFYFFGVPLKVLTNKTATSQKQNLLISCGKKNFSSVVSFLANLSELFVYSC